MLCFLNNEIADGYLPGNIMYDVQCTMCVDTLVTYIGASWVLGFLGSWALDNFLFFFSFQIQCGPVVRWVYEILQCGPVGREILHASSNAIYLHFDCLLPYHEKTLWPRQSTDPLC